MLKSIRLIIIISAFGTMVSCGPNEAQIKVWNSDAKSRLHNMFLVCQAFWAENGSEKNCTEKELDNPDYGIAPDPEVKISASGSEANFSATASHKNSEQVFSMDSSYPFSDIKKLK